MEYYSGADWLYGKRIDFSEAPPKKTISRNRKKCCSPFFSLGGPNGPIEQEQITPRVMKMDATEGGRRSQLAVACAKDTAVNAYSAGEAQDSAWTQTRYSSWDGTNDLEQPRSVPLVPRLFGEG